MLSRIPVLVQDDSHKESPGEVIIQTFDPSTRTKRALKILGLWWGMGICAVVLPIVHFFAVPGCLIAGPVLAWITYHRKSLIIEGSSTCPKCKAPFKISKSKEEWPLQDTCSKCYQPVWITPIANAANLLETPS